MRQLQGGRPAKVAERPGRSLSQQHKDKISAARIAYLEANPDKVPYLLNHYTLKERSYPEEYFFDILTAENLSFVEQHRVGLYALDFAFLETMTDLEINGSQHYDDPRIVESDIRRKAFLEGLGWTVITVDWRAYQKLDFVARTAFVAELLLQLRPRTM